MCYVKHFVNIYNNLVRIPYENVQTFVRTFYELITCITCCYDYSGTNLERTFRIDHALKWSIIYYIDKFQYSVESSLTFIVWLKQLFKYFKINNCFNGLKSNNQFSNVLV